MNPWNTTPLQGGRRTRRYFEGWYFKQVSRDRRETWSIIPGISRGSEESQAYSFVQVIEGRTGRTWWFEYPASAFSASSKKLDIIVGNSRFSREGIELSLREGETYLAAEISFGPFATLPPRVFAPGVMGPYSFAPFMECSHGLVSLDHELGGWMEIEGRRSSLEGGRGYAEKDWGSSMPSSWIWTQSNNFPVPGDSFMFSVAKVPWLGSSFNGFLCAARLGGSLVLEASWTGAELRELQVMDDSVEFALGRGKHLVEARITRSRGGILRAPVEGLLTRRIAESVDAELEVRWSEAGLLRFEGRALNAGLEIVGEAAALAD
jgi:hypothetical protein